LGNFVDDFAGTAGTVSKSFGSPVTKPFVTTYAPYVQDTWRLTPNFTLDLGMRYEYWGTPENTLLYPAADLSAGIGLPGQSFPNKFAHPQQGDLNNFAPRVGFAYTPRMWQRLFGREKTVIRAGYGIFYDGIFTNILDNTAGTLSGLRPPRTLRITGAESRVLPPYWPGLRRSSILLPRSLRFRTISATHLPNSGI
jgi:hypothetical protein